MKTIVRNGHNITFDDDLALRWVEALESGKYRQGENALRSKGKFCCLGVVSDIADPDGWEGKQWHGVSASLADELQLRLALNGFGDGKWKSIDSNSLTGANDNGVSFLDIAAALRDYYEFPPTKPEPIDPVCGSGMYFTPEHILALVQSDSESEICPDCQNVDGNHDESCMSR